MPRKQTPDLRLLACKQEVRELEGVVHRLQARHAIIERLEADVTHLITALIGRAEDEENISDMQVAGPATRERLALGQAFRVAARELQGVAERHAMRVKDAEHSAEV